LVGELRDVWRGNGET